MKAMVGSFLHNLSNDKLQVHGIAVLGDLTDFQVKHQTYWTLDDLKRSAKMMNVRIMLSLLNGLTNNDICKGSVISLLRSAVGMTHVLEKGL